MFPQFAFYSYEFDFSPVLDVSYGQHSLSFWFCTFLAYSPPCFLFSAPALLPSSKTFSSFSKRLNTPFLHHHSPSSITPLFEDHAIPGPTLLRETNSLPLHPPPTQHCMPTEEATCFFAAFLFYCFLFLSEHIKTHGPMSTCIWPQPS